MGAMKSTANPINTARMNTVSLSYTSIPVNISIRETVAGSEASANSAAAPSDNHGVASKKDKKTTAGTRGEDRKKHFASGGSLAEWRGTSSVHKNKKDKRKDRATVKRQAIKESQDE